MRVDLNVNVEQTGNLAVTCQHIGHGESIGIHPYVTPMFVTTWNAYTNLHIDVSLGDSVPESVTQILAVADSFGAYFTFFNVKFHPK